MSAPLQQVALFDPPPADDALGEAYSQTNTPEDRRAHGITLTPHWLVDRNFDCSRWVSLPKDLNFEKGDIQCRF